MGPLMVIDIHRPGFWFYLVTIPANWTSDKSDLGV